MHSVIEILGTLGNLEWIDLLVFASQGRVWLLFQKTDDFSKATVKKLDAFRVRLLINSSNDGQVVKVLQVYCKSESSLVV